MSNPVPSALLADVYNVQLGGVGLITEPGTYQEFAITAFAPRIAVANPSHGTLDAWQSSTQDDFSHGFGFIDAQDAGGYDYASGNIDTRHPHLLMQFPALHSSATPAQAINCMVDDLFHPYLYAGLNAAASSTTLWRNDGTNWAAAPAGVAGAVLSITVTNVGTSYTTIPGVTLTGGGGSGATAAARMQAQTPGALSAAGSGYAINDTITLAGGTFSQAVVITVNTIGGGGSIATFTITTFGSYSVLPANPVAQSSTSGAGTGATFTLTNWTVQSIAVTAGGTGYTSAPTVGFTGGGGGANAAATATINIGDGLAGGRPNVAITDILSSQDASGNAKLFLALGQSAGFQTFDGTNYATPIASAKANLFCIAGGFMWYADNANNVYYSSDPTAAWSAPIKVGSPAHPITALVEYGMYLYVGKTNGWYIIQPGSDRADPMVTFNDQIGANNCVGAKVWQGYLYFSILSRFYRLSPANALSDITPGKFTTTWPYAYLQNFRAFVTGRLFLYYVAQRTDDSSYQLMAFDGGGHHILAQVCASPGVVSLRGGCFSQIAANPRLFFATNESGGKNYYANLSNSELPFPDYPTMGTHFVETSRENFSLPEIIKSWKDVTIEQENYAQGRYIDVQFALDDSSTFQSVSNVASASPGTGSDSSSVGTVAWSNPTNAKVRDNVYATAALNANTSHYLFASNFGFNLPSTAIVRGVVVSIFGHTDNGLATDSSVNLFVAGAATGTNHAGLGNGNFGSTLPFTDVALIYGGSSDLWGATLPPSSVNASNFGVGFSYTCGGVDKVSIDYIKVTVYYSNTGRYVTIPFDRVDGKAQQATSTTLTDATNLVQADNHWVGATVDIVAGTGYGQARTISASDLTTFSVTLAIPWDTMPDATSVYQITWQSRVIRFRLLLSTTSSANTLVIKSRTVRFVPRPPLKRGWRFAVPAGDVMENNRGLVQPNLGGDKMKLIALAQRDVKAPIKYVDKDGLTYFVEVTDVEITEKIDNPADAQQRGRRSYSIRYSLAEAY